MVVLVLVVRGFRWVLEATEKAASDFKIIATRGVTHSQGLWGLEFVAPLPLISLSSLCFCPIRTWNRYPGGMD